jgi:hypothetical protein
VTSTPREAGLPWRDLDAKGGRLTRTEVGHRAGRSARQSRQALQEYYAEQCWKEREEFDQLPGIRLRLEWAGVARCELRTAEQQTLASMSYRWFHILLSDMREMGDYVSTSKGIFFLRKTTTAHSRNLVDEARIPILETSGRNFERSAQASISFPDRRSLRFPVRGANRGNAIMTAVDEAGKQPCPVPDCLSNGQP